jgi:hypothetical protein
MSDDALYLNASRDAVSMVASLRKGEPGNALVLAALYRGDERALEALCMALAALANACLTMVDTVPLANGVSFPGDAMLKSVMMSLAEHSV